MGGVIPSLQEQREGSCNTAEAKTSPISTQAFLGCREKEEEM